MTCTVKTMPHDKTAEQYVLGSMLLSVNAVNHCIPQLDASDFYFSENQAIFQTICKLYKLGFAVNSMNVAQELKENKLVAWQYVMHLDLSSSGIDHDYYMQQILNLSRLRKVITASQECLVQAVKPEMDSQEVISKLQNDLFHVQGLGLQETVTPQQIVENFHEGRSFEDHTLWAFDEIRSGRLPYTGVSSGYQTLDKTLGYFRPGGYYTIGARTSMGKTTFMLNLIRNMNMLGRKTSIGFFSLEMPAKIITAKLICLFAGVRYADLDDARLSVQELESVLTWGKSMASMPIYIEDQSGITISQLRARAKRMLQNHKIEVLFIDYLTLVKPDSKLSNNHLAINEVSKGIQQLAKELQIPIIVLAQLNRQVAGRTGNVPTLADFRESGSIEEDSDACLMLHRPEYYDPNNKPGVAQVIVAKNRIRGQLSKIEYHVPYGEVYEELGLIKHAVQEIQEEAPRFKNYYDKD